MAAKYFWSFGDGDSVTISNPTHIFKAAGTYQVKLIVTSTSGCNDTITKDVTVHPLPTADFNFTNTCFRDSVNFTNTSSLAASNLWNFGDGNTSTLANPSHQYKAPGSYKVMLLVNSPSNCKDTITKVVIVNSLPVADFDFKNTCLGDTVDFTYTGISGTKYYWNFGDGNTSLLANPSHKYLSAGSTTVKLKVWNSAGCTDSISKIITINPLPAVSISLVKDTNSVRKYTFSSTSKAMQYLWSFGDGTIDSGKTVNHTYKRDSTYKVSLAVRDTNGCTAIGDTTINVFTVGINEMQVPAFKLKLYPNPFSHFTTLEYELQFREHIAISIYDLAGKEISVIQRGTQNEGKYSYTIDSDKYQLKAGIYILKVVAGSRVITRQLVKVKE